MVSVSVEGDARLLQRLLETARGVAGRSRTVQAAVARLEGVVLPEHLPDRVRDDVLAAIERARADTSWRLPVSDVERELAGELDSLEEPPTPWRPTPRPTAPCSTGRRCG